MSGLAEDMEGVVAPLRQMAERLSLAERFLVETTCDEVIRLCEDEEQQAAVTVALLNEAEERLDDQ